MTDEYSRAMSFANNYFALVDGLAYGLEEHLAEDVSLSWFGKTVNGKRNVASFMRINMTNSRHIFDDVTPASGILTKKRISRRKHRCKEISAESAKVPDAFIKNGLNFEKLRIDDSHETKEEKIEAIEPSSVIRREIDTICTENFAENTVRRESDNGQYFVPPNSRMECAVDIPSSSPENSMKFIRANGIVHIHRSSGPNKIRKWRSSGFVSGLPGHACRRHCKLQVAYTRRGDRTNERKDGAARSRSAGASRERTIEPGDSGERKRDAKAITCKGRKRLNSQEEETRREASFADTAESTFDPFEDFDSFDERRRFLEYFDTEMAPKFNFTSARCIGGDRPVFDRPRSNETAIENRVACFKFDYSIHTLVYESNATSSLTEEFEDRRSLSDTEKSV